MREFLSSVREARFDMERCRRKLLELDAQCCNSTARLGGLPGGGAGDPHGDQAWAALADQAALLRELYDRAVRRETEVERFISRLGNSTHRILLRLKYADGLSWPQVQERMQESGIYYSERQLYRIHGDALQEARRLWADLRRERGDGNT